jgi:cytochrome c-type biogenesis protein CcmH/NrfG
VITARRVVVLLVAVLLFYAVVIGRQGVELLGDHRWTVKVLGIGVLLLPLVGAVLVAGEVRFGLATQRLGRALGPEDGAREEDREPDPDAAFDRRADAVRAEPENWRAWYRLAVAYGDAHDTPRGRKAMRRAVRLEAAERSTGPSRDAARAHDRD